MSGTGQPRLFLTGAALAANTHPLLLLPPPVPAPGHLHLTQIVCKPLKSISCYKLGLLSIFRNRLDIDIMSFLLPSSLCFHTPYLGIFCLHFQDVFQSFPEIILDAFIRYNKWSQFICVFVAGESAAPSVVARSSLTSLTGEEHCSCWLSLNPHGTQESVSAFVWQNDKCTETLTRRDREMMRGGIYENTGNTQIFASLPLLFIPCCIWVVQVQTKARFFYSVSEINERTEKRKKLKFSHQSSLFISSASNSTGLKRFLLCSSASSLVCLCHIIQCVHEVLLGLICH